MSEKSLNNDFVVTIDQCWCGSKELDRFSDHYYKCKGCQTLVCSPRMPEELYRSKNDAENFYGKDYWLKYVKEELGSQDIMGRSRDDLAERCIYWLREILNYRRPPATALELGCAHGGLVFLMKLAGYDSAGTEISKWVCEFGERSFHIPVMSGRIEDLESQLKKYDVILLMDLLEHLPDPIGSVRKIADVLKDDGMIVIQTPCWKGKKYEEMKEKQDPFMLMFQPKEHLYLFNEKSIERLLKEAGFNDIAFERALFVVTTHMSNTFSQKIKLQRKHLGINPSSQVLHHRV